MNANYDFENLKSIKFSKNYENKNTDYKTIDFVNSEALKKKLSILENNIKYSNLNKNRQTINVNFEKNDNLISNYYNAKDNDNEKTQENESINNSIKLMDIKLNHQILQNKIESMRKTLIKEPNDSNYNTDSTSNYLDINHMYVKNHPQNNVTPKNFNNQNDFNGKIFSKDKENNLNFINLSKENKVNPIQNNYLTSDNFYNQRVQFNMIDDQFSERLRNNNYRDKIGMSEREDDFLTKTIGNDEYLRYSILPNSKINNNEMKLYYTKKDLADLDGKIENTKRKLYDCIHKAETLIVDKKYNNRVLEKDILNENIKHLNNYKTLDSKWPNDFNNTNAIGSSNEISISDRTNLNRKLKDNVKYYYKNAKDPQQNYQTQNILSKKNESKGFATYKQDSSSEISIDNSLNGEINIEHNKDQESYSTFNPRSTLNQIDNRNNYREDKRLNLHLRKYNSGSKSDRTDRFDKNKNYNDNQSKISGSRNENKIQKLNQEENLNTIQTISNTNNNTINIMDSVRISENSEENLEDNNPFLNHDKSSNIHLNISGIPADLVSIKNGNVNNNTGAVQKIRGNQEYLKIEEEKNYRHSREKGNKKNKEPNDECIEANLRYGWNPPMSAKNKDNKFFYLEEKRSLIPNPNLKYSKQLDISSNNLTPRSKKNQFSIKNDQLKNIGNSISPIKNDEKGKFTEREIEELISKYLEQNKPIDPPNNINQLKNLAKNLNKKSSVDKDKLKNLIFNEFKNDKSINRESEFSNNHFAPRVNEYDDKSYIEGDCGILVEAANKPRSEIAYKDHDFKDLKSEKENKIKDIFKKIPEIVSEFNDKKGKVIKENTELDKPKTQFFNVDNLSKWIDLRKTNLGKNTTIDITNDDLNITGKDILNEADHIINNHKLKMKNNLNIKENNNNSHLQVENILRDENSEIKKSETVSIQKKQNFDKISSKEQTEESKETLDNKINYIYDLLKNFSHTKLKDLITNQTQVNKKVLKEEISHNLNESTQVRETVQRLSNKDNLANKKYEKEIECRIPKDEKDILFSDNKKISFENPKGPIRLREEEESNLFREFEDNDQQNEMSPNILFSSEAKGVLEDNNYNPNNNLIQGDFSEIKKDDLSKIEFVKTQKIREDPYEIIEKREEKIIENNIVIEKPEITESPEKREISSTKLKKKPTLNKKENNKNVIIKAIDNGIKENQMESNHENLVQEQTEDEEFQVVTVSNRNDFSDIYQDEELVDYELSRGNQEKEYDDLEGNEYNQKGDQFEEEKSCTEIDNQNIYGEEEPRSLNNCINKLNSSSNKKEEKQHVKFEKFLHSNSAKIITSRNLKTKNVEILRSDFENGIEENQMHNHSDLEIQNEKIDDEIKTELNKDVIVDTPLIIVNQKGKVKFSEKLVYIEYDDESLAENIKVYNQTGKPEKHIKFNLLKYLIRIKNNKYKAKKILHYYYNGIRDDCLPKKLLSNLKRKNSFSELDKELGLKKLNEFLSECKKESQLSDIKEQQKKRIVERNINTIHEIEKARKNGTKIKRVRSPTPKKIVQSHVCKKFKGDPNKFFSKNPPDSLLKVFNIPIDNSGLRSARSIGKFSERIFNKTTTDKRLTDNAINDQDKRDKSKENNNRLHEFNLDSNDSKKNQKEKELNNIISNINLEESMNSLEKDSHIFRESGLLQDITSLNSYVQSPEQNTIQ